MPWSPWQDPFPVKINPQRVGLQWIPGNASMNQTVPAPFPLQSGVNLTRAEITSASGVQFSLDGTGWDTYHEWWPPHLYDLREGVDFDYIPGTWDYVEYDAGPNVPQGWELGEFHAGGMVTGTSGEQQPDPPPEMTARVGLLLDSGYPLFTDQPLPAFPGAGAVFGTWSAAGTPLPQPTAPGSSVLSFSVVVDGTMPDAEVGGFETRGFAQVYYEQPMFSVLMPRWRYWIPGPDKPLPLRQRQRDDGLGLSTGRWRKGTSRQASNRWRGYL